MDNARLVAAGAVTILVIGTVTAPAANVVIDYSFDTSGMFAVGSQARSAVDSAAAFYSQVLGDTLLEIETPPPFTSSLPPALNPGTAQWEWTMAFLHPSIGDEVNLVDQTIDADEYRIYAGGKSLPGNSVGATVLSGWSYRSFNDGGQFTFDEIDQLNAITDAFSEAVETRGQSSGFTGWGATISFDADANWHYSPTTQPPQGTTDMFSVAIHEIGHALGLGSSNEWNALVIGREDNAQFVGPAAISEYGSNVPLAFFQMGANIVADKTHWRDGTVSTVFGSSMLQDAALDPSLDPGARKQLTALDAAALVDIGWTVIEDAAGVAGDYNGNGIVDAADYTVWRDMLGQTGTALAADGAGPTGGPDGVVDQFDYDFWKIHFGSTATTGSVSVATEVPEMATHWALLIASLLVLASPRRYAS